MDVDSFKKFLAEIRELHQENKYLESFQLIERLLKDCPYSVELLVKKARVIQLLGDNSPSAPGLEAVKEILKLACLIAPEATEPAMELGHFEYAINNRPMDAINHFAAARKNAEASLKVALIGEIKCYIDINELVRARSLTEQAKLLFPKDTELGILEFELQAHENN